jgi:hypothetical protein
MKGVGLGNTQIKRNMQGLYEPHQNTTIKIYPQNNKGCKGSFLESIANFHKVLKLKVSAHTIGCGIKINLKCDQKLMRRVFNLWLDPTQQQIHNRISAGFSFQFPLVCTNSKATITFCRIYQSICSYGPTTTQQQIHNRTPAGFYINSMYVSHNPNHFTLGLIRSFVQNPIQFPINQLHTQQRK